MKPSTFHFLVGLFSLMLFSNFFALYAQQKTLYRKPTTKTAFEGSYSLGSPRLQNQNTGSSHIGFWIGAGANSLIMTHEPDTLRFFSAPNRLWAGGVMIEYGLSSLWAFRFMPSLSKQSYIIDYQNFSNISSITTGTIQYDKLSFEIPLLLVFRSQIRQHWRAYLQAGLRTEVALSQSLIENNVRKLNFSNLNIAWEYGVGVEKLLGRNAPLFERIGVELRFSRGITDVLLQSLNINNKPPIKTIFVNRWQINLYFIFAQ